MMNVLNAECRKRSARGFTLIEMLVVVAIIALLAGIGVAVMGRASGTKVDSRAKGELAQLLTAIEAYKAKKGFYPPSNGGDVTKPPLYYELKGTKKTPAGYETLDGVGSVRDSDLNNYGVQGFVNSTTAGAADVSDPDRPAVENFHEKLKQGLQTTGGTNVVYLGIAHRGPDGNFSRWRYNSVNPTNNRGSFDLWIELEVGGKTNVYANWKQ